jgi:hypothetical protein
MLQPTSGTPRLLVPNGLRTAIKNKKIKSSAKRTQPFSIFNCQFSIAVEDRTSAKSKELNARIPEKKQFCTRHIRKESPIYALLFGENA